MPEDAASHTAGQERQRSLPAELSPTLPADVDRALSTVGDATGAALRLTEGYGGYDDEGSGEPLDADAETETRALAAREQLGRLADTIEGWQTDLAARALEAYEEHLYYDATTGFEYHGIDEEVRGVELWARFEEAYELARTLAPDLDKGRLMRCGFEELVGKLRAKIPQLRAEASSAGGRHSHRPGPPTPGEREGERRAQQAAEALLEAEEALDLLLHHLLHHRNHPEHHSKADETGVQDEFVPAPNPPRNYAVVVYHPEQDPGKTGGTVLWRSATEEVARMRRADLESGVCLGLPTGLPTSKAAEGVESPTASVPAVVVERVGQEG